MTDWVLFFAEAYPYTVTIGDPYFLAVVVLTTPFFCKSGDACYLAFGSFLLEPCLFTDLSLLFAAL